MAKLKDRVLAALSKQKRSAISVADLARRSGVRKTEKNDFQQLVGSLREENRLIEYKGKLMWAEGAGLIEAEIVKVTGTFGFARITEEERDVFVPGRMLLGSMPGDKVLLSLARTSTGELPEGEVVKILEEARQRFTGVLVLNQRECHVVPDRYVKFPVAVSRKKLLGAVDGDKVVAEITQRGQRHSEHFAKIIESFGAATSAAACSKAILSANEIPIDFPPEALEQARGIAAGKGIHPNELASRLDLREEIIFTIDGADSKDLDDAVSVKRLGDGWELGVHIADVSHYVTQKSPLDEEAYRRGTSVYFADSVIPMLPEELSNDVCSLNPDEDRLAFSVLVNLGREGNITGYRFHKTVIRSRVKGVYSEVNAVLGGTADEAVARKYAPYESQLRELQRLAAVLMKAKRQRGGMEMETVESKIIVGPDGRTADVQARERGESERIIEELMLIANEAAATFALEKELPFVFRVHENPDPDRLERLFTVLDQLGVSFQRPQGPATTGLMADILDKVQGQPYQTVVNTMVLRSMAKAQYSDADTGHFGLALRHYAHFTSPIRRYPDLTIHRILTAYVHGMKPENLRRRFASFAPRSANQSTEREVVAMTAERDCEDVYKAEYMSRFVGEEFDGSITSAVSHGIYVQLPNTVEGLVSIRGIPGDWAYDDTIALVNRTTGRKLQVGEKVRVLVENVNIALGQIDFKLVGEEFEGEVTPPPPRQPRGPRSPRTGGGRPQQPKRPEGAKQEADATNNTPSKRRRRRRRR